MKCLLLPLLSQKCIGFIPNAISNSNLHLTESRNTDDNHDNIQNSEDYGHNRRSFLSRSALIGISSWGSNNFLPKSIASAATEVSPDLTSWPLGKVAFSLLPLAGTYSRRATVEKEVIPNIMWTYDQIQGVVNVNVPVRQVVIKLSPEAGGGLFVHNPVAPTKQLITMMSDLEKRHGPVRHIVLGK